MPNSFDTDRARTCLDNLVTAYSALAEGDMMRCHPDDIVTEFRALLDVVAKDGKSFWEMTIYNQRADRAAKVIEVHGRIATGNLSERTHKCTAQEASAVRAAVGELRMKLGMQVSRVA